MIKKKLDVLRRNDSNLKKSISPRSTKNETKKSIPSPDLKVTINPAHVADRDPSLGARGQSFIVTSNDGSLRFRSVGTPSLLADPNYVYPFGPVSRDCGQIA